MKNHSGLGDNYWDRLDNAAKLVPAVSDSRGSNVFRVSAVLSSEVDPDILEKALSRALRLLPAFAVKLHRGLFWYYLDANRETPPVREENAYPCSPIWKASKERGFLFRLTYYHRRVNLEVFHALSDGMGTARFLQLILLCYFSIIDGRDVPPEYISEYCDRVARDFDEDSFARHSGNSADEEQKKSPKKKEPDAFHIQGFKYDDTRLGVLTASLPSDKMLELAHAHGATMSEYMCALIIYSIINTSYRRSMRSKPVVVSLPVNLRKMFGSTTMRNFFGHASISVTPRDSMSFDEVLDEVKRRFDECLTKEYFEKQIDANVGIEKIGPVKFVPVWIKDLVMRLLFSRAEKKYTITFSNLGLMQFPETAADKLRRFEMLLGGSRTHPKKATLCSYRNEMALTFTSTIDDNSLERFLIRFLVSNGIEVTITSNETPEPPFENKSERAEKRRLEKAEKKARKRSEKESRRLSKKSAKEAKKSAKKAAKEAKRSAKKQSKDEKRSAKKAKAKEGQEGSI